MNKKIALFVPSLSSAGGAEKTAAMLANALAESGFMVRIYVMSSVSSAFELNENVECVLLDVCGKKNALVRNYSRFKCINQNIRDCDLIIGYTIQGGILACVFSILTGIKCIVCERQDPYQFSKTRRIARDLLYHKAAGAVFQTEDARRYFDKIVSNSVVIPNFIETQFLPAPCPFEDRNNYIVTAGRLVDAKDQIIILKAFNEIKDKAKGYKVIIYGEGHLRSTLESYIAAHGLTNFVCLYGHTSDILSEYNKSKIFVLSSKYEGYPNALLEALAMGMACISTDCPCGGPKDMIIPGYNGELFKVGDYKTLSHHLLNYIEHANIANDYATNALILRELNAKDKIIVKWLVFIKKIINI